jgi:hypothetical protein
MAQWRDCLTGVISSGSIPENWIDVAYTRPEGGTCYEPLYLNFSENAINFSATQGVVNTETEVKTISIENISSVNKYTVTLDTENTVFSLSPATLEILPNQTQLFTIALPKQNTIHFDTGLTKINLTVSVKVSKIA